MFLVRRYGEAIEADLALRGWDLAVLWRKRRFRFLLNIINHLPRDSYFVEAIAQDDEIAEAHKDEPTPRYEVSVAEFGATQELLAAIHDLIAQLNTNFVTANSSKRNAAKRTKPWPRPITATGRLKKKQTEADFLDIVARFAPHEISRFN